MKGLLLSVATFFLTVASRIQSLRPRQFDHMIVETTASPIWDDKVDKSPEDVPFHLASILTERSQYLTAKLIFYTIL